MSNALDILHCEIGTVSSRKDGSLGFRVETPELTRDQKAVIFDFHGKAARVLIAPAESGLVEIEEVETEKNTKTPCQRLRGVLFVHFSQLGSKGDFETFYRQQMDKIIHGYQEKNLEPRA